jgi:membrane associated rhomboid family serine protease
MASEALKIARLQCSTQLTSQVLGIATDPLWSTILGFVTVHELRKRDLVGPVADDILYAGIIAVNTARTPGLADLAGKGISAGVTAAAAVGGTMAGVAGTKLVPAIAGVKTVKPTQTVAQLGKALAEGNTVRLGFGPLGVQKISDTPEARAAWKAKPAWKRFLGL